MCNAEEGDSDSDRFVRHAAVKGPLHVDARAQGYCCSYSVSLEVTACCKAEERKTLAVRPIAAWHTSIMSSSSTSFPGSWASLTTEQKQVDLGALCLQPQQHGSALAGHQSTQKVTHGIVCRHWGSGAVGGGNAWVP